MIPGNLRCCRFHLPIRKTVQQGPDVLFEPPHFVVGFRQDALPVDVPVPVLPSMEGARDFEEKDEGQRNDGQNQDTADDERDFQKSQTAKNDGQSDKEKEQQEARDADCAAG